MCVPSKLVFAALIPVAICSCSIHPLPEDVTRVATFDIVKKIRCEARDAIKEHAVVSTSNFDAALASIINNPNDVVVAIKRELAELGKHYDEIVAQIKQPSDYAKANEDFKTAFKGVFSEKKALSKYYDSHKFEMKLNQIHLFKGKNREIEIFYKSKALLDNFEIEINQWLNDVHKGRLANLLRFDLRNTAIGYGFKLTMSESNGAAGSSKFLVPFSNGSFSLGVNFGESKERKNERSFELIEYLSELIGDPTLLNCGAPEKNWKYPVVGTIGLAEVIYTYARLAGLNKFDRSGSGSGRSDTGNDTGAGRASQSDKREVSQFSDILTFTTTYSGSVAPKIELAPVVDRLRLTAASAEFGGGRSDVHRVTIALRTTQKDVFADDQPKKSLGAGRGSAYAPLGYVADDAKDQLRTFFKTQRTIEDLSRSISEQ